MTSTANSPCIMAGPAYGAETLISLVPLYGDSVLKICLSFSSAPKSDHIGNRSEYVCCLQGDRASRLWEIVSGTILQCEFVPMPSSRLSFPRSWSPLEGVSCDIIRAIWAPSLGESAYRCCRATAFDLAALADRLFTVSFCRIRSKLGLCTCFPGTLGRGKLFYLRVGKVDTALSLR
jgi:hypothetical protein